MKSYNYHQMLFYTIVLVATVVPVVAAVVIFGNTPGLRNTGIHRIRRGLLGVFSLVYKVYEQLDDKCGGRLLYYINWIVPMLYVFVVSFCFQQFFTKTYPILQEMGEVGILKQVYIYIAMGLVYVATYLATFTDPGKPGDENQVIFPNNQLIFFNNKICHTCNLIKPARSKHCSLCNSCYLLFDHHCIWINNCVGLYNYKWFMLYLFTNINFLVYGGYLCFTALDFKSRQLNLNYWQVIKFDEATKVTGIFVILCFTFSLITLAFTLLHLRYIYLGVTTNEADKWLEIEYLIHSGLLYKLDTPINDELYVEKAGHMGKIVYISLNSDKILIDSNQNVNLVKITSIEHDIDNIYDQGFWQNLKQRLLI